MKQHPVPENIMDVEFKLFGSLTAKQFGYIIGGGLSGLFFFYLFKSLGSTFLGWIFAFLTVVLGVSLALIRINEQPFEIWLGNFVAAMFSSQKRVWKKEKKMPEALKKDSKKIQPAAVSAQPTQKTLPSEPIKSNENVKEPKIPLHPFKDISSGSPSKGTVQSSVPQQPSPNQTTVSPVSQGTTVPSQNEGVFVPGSAQGYVGAMNNQQVNRPVDTSSLSAGVQTKPATNIPTNQQQQVSSGDNKNIIKTGMNVTNIQSDNSLQNQNNQKQQGQNLQPVTKESGSINQDFNALPSKNMGVSSPANQPVEQKKVQNIQGPVYQNKAVAYSDIVPSKNQVINQAYSSKPQDDPKTTAQGQGDINFNKENKALREKVADVTEQKSQMENELSKIKSSYNSLQSQNEQILKELEKIKNQYNQEMQIDVSQREVKERENVLSPKVYNGPSLARKPNVISGIVKSKDGKLLPGVVVIVKNEKSRPVRAMKTNSLGQFMTTTPLENGIYTIELTKDNYSFRIYEVSLNGDLLPSYEFIGE